MMRRIDEQVREIKNSLARKLLRRMIEKLDTEIVIDELTAKPIDLN
jgi:hypothetical protein